MSHLHLTMRRVSLRCNWPLHKLTLSKWSAYNRSNSIFFFLNLFLINQNLKFHLKSTEKNWVVRGQNSLGLKAIYPQNLVKAFNIFRPRAQLALENVGWYLIPSVWNILGWQIWTWKKMGALKICQGPKWPLNLLTYFNPALPVVLEIVHKFWGTNFQKNVRQHLRQE